MASNPTALTGINNVFNKYITNKSDYSYPTEYQNPKAKEEKMYHIAYAKAMIADWCNNQTELPFAFDNTKRTFSERHHYSRGTYSNYKLKDRAIGSSDKHKTADGRHITKMNISFDTLPVMAKMFDVMREKNMNQEYTTEIYCVDDDSVAAMNADKNYLKYLVNPDTQELMGATGYKPPMKIDPNKLGMTSDDDVELFFDCGAYTYELEMACLAALNKSRMVSKNKEWQDRVFDDLCTHAIACGKNDIDPVTRVPYTRHVQVYNPELDRCCIVLPFSQHNDFRDMMRFGEIRTMTLGQYRRENKDVDALQLIAMGQAFQSINPEYSMFLGGGYDFYDNSTGGYDIEKISRVKILVIDCEWLGVDYNYYVKNSERTLFKAVDYGYEPTQDRKRKGDKVSQKRTLKKHFCQWVIGTEYMDKYGVSNDVVYYGPDGDMVPGLNYFACKTGTAPVIERGIAIQDDIDLANVKLRNTLSAAIPAPRMVVQQGLLDNVFMNNIRVEPQDNFATFRELGYLMVNAVDDNGKPIFTNQKLVEFLQTGTAEDVNMFTGQILAGINSLREVFGMAQGADASTPQKYDSAEKTELSQQNSNAALFPTFAPFQYLIETRDNDLIKKWQIVAKDKDFRLGYSPLGSKNLRTLALTKEFTMAEFNIGVRLGNTADDLNALMADIKNLRQVGLQTNFQQGITTSEYLYLNETIKGGNTKLAWWVMAKIEKKKMEAQSSIEQQNQNNNIIAQQNSAAQAELNKQGTVQIEGRENRLTMVLKGLLDQQTQATGGYMKDFAKEGGESAAPAYKQIMDNTNSKIMGIIQHDDLQDQQQDAQNQQSAGGGQEPQQGPTQQNNMPQQQVA